MNNLRNRFGENNWRSCQEKTKRESDVEDWRNPSPELRKPRIFTNNIRRNLRQSSPDYYYSERKKPLDFQRGRSRRRESSPEQIINDEKISRNFQRGGIRRRGSSPEKQISICNKGISGRNFQRGRIQRRELSPKEQIINEGNSDINFRGGNSRLRKFSSEQQIISERISLKDKVRYKF